MKRFRAIPLLFLPCTAFAQTTDPWEAREVALEEELPKILSDWQERRTALKEELRTISDKAQKSPEETRRQGELINELVNMEVLGRCCVTHA